MKMSQIKSSRPRLNKNMNQESTYLLIRNKLSQKENERSPKRTVTSKQVRNIISDINKKEKNILIICSHLQD